MLIPNILENTSHVPGKPPTRFDPPKPKAPVEGLPPRCAAHRFHARRLRAAPGRPLRSRLRQDGGHCHGHHGEGRKPGHGGGGPESKGKNQVFSGLMKVLVRSLGILGRENKRFWIVLGL